jgi:hypothetical protein
MSLQPFTLVYLNAASLPAQRLAQWQQLVTSPALDPALPSTPLLYVFVESGTAAPRPGVPEWSCSHLPGPPPKNRGVGGGGISLLYHADCPIQPLTSHHLRVPAKPNDAVSDSTSVSFHIVRPRHRSPFLLAAVYLPPSCVAKADTYYVDQVTKSIETVAALHPALPLLVVGDFNLWHDCWYQTPNINGASACAKSLARWIDRCSLAVHNEPGMVTHRIGTTSTIIDLVLSDPPTLVTSLSQSFQDWIQSDHLPFTITLSLPSAARPPRPANDRPRQAWDHLADPTVWQGALPAALAAALSPLQPELQALTLPLPVGITPQAALDQAYTHFEQVLTSVCLSVVGTKEVRPHSVPWFKYEGVADTYLALRTARRRCRGKAIDAQLQAASAEWKRVSTEAKRQASVDLCQGIMDPASKLRWTLFKRTALSPFTSLASIMDASNALPADHVASLGNVCAAFLTNSRPPQPPANPAAYSAVASQVQAWGDPANPLIPAHESDSWVFTPADVQQQCTRQHTKSAPGPDAILPIFLKHAGPATWQALSTLFTFSWTHSVTPQAWREANVMALYKGDGSRAEPGSYRPISMTSILIRTFEHLIHRRITAILDPAILQAAPPGYFARTQFGFRARRSTTDAINYLITSVQRVLKRNDKPSAQCPVLFLDIKKAFDRVDHNLLLHRVQAAGISGRAWLWIKAFLTDRRMRVVDSSEASDWMDVEFGVPQGCVLSPLLFLVFINDLLQTILRDSRCSHIVPLFYADDGAIVPRPFPTSSPPSVNYAAAYLAELKVVLTLLDQWCIDSRMLFGKEKTQLVVFSGRWKPDHSLYTALTVCGFTIEVVKHYTYLGVIVDHRLEWERHFHHALARARGDSTRITRIALGAASGFHPAVRSLVMGYLIPRFAYGCLFWGRKLRPSKCRQLESAMAKPLRAVLQLPTTTHLLGVLHLSNVPTFSSLVLKEELLFAMRTEGLPSTHPTRYLHDKCLQEAASADSWVALSPGYCLDTATHIATYALPRAMYGVGPLLSAAEQATFNTPPRRAGWDLGIQYWALRPGPNATRTWAQNDLQHPAFKAIFSTSALGRPHLTRPIIRSLYHWSSTQEWKAQDAAASATSHPTTAPLRSCKPSPCTSPYLALDSRSQSVRRSRLLMGRAYTQQVRHRFPKSGEAVIPPTCTFPLCQPPANSPLEAPHDTVNHSLVRCHRHDAARQQLQTRLATLGCPATLYLSTILGASVPPRPFRKRSIPLLLSYTNSFLDEVEAARAADTSLIPFDPG